MSWDAVKWINQSILLKPRFITIVQTGNFSYLKKLAFFIKRFKTISNFFLKIRHLEPQKIYERMFSFANVSFAH